MTKCHVWNEFGMKLIDSFRTVRLSDFGFSVLALTVNCMLLRIVFTSDRRDIGSYRYLIATFAVSDLLYTSIHWLVYPVNAVVVCSFFSFMTTLICMVMVFHVHE